MTDTSVEEFARKLVQRVRDEAIESCDQLLRPGGGSRPALRWKAAIEESGGAETLRALLPDIVDKTVFRLLDAIDNENIQLFYEDDRGRRVDLAEEGMGELAGWYVGPDGWRERFSTQRLNAFAADVAPDRGADESERGGHP